MAAWGAFAGCSLIWGSTYLAISFGNDALPPVWAASLRLAVAAAVMGALVAVRRLPLPRGPALRAAAGYGFLQFGINMPLLYWGEKEVPSGLAAVLFATIPLSTAVFARLLGMGRLQPRKLAGALVAVGGVAVLAGLRGAGRVPLLPLGAVALATLCASLGTVLLKRGPRQDPMVANGTAALVGLPVCLLISFAAGESHALPATARAWFPVLYLALAGSVVAFGLMTWLLHHWDITTLSFTTVISPVLALALGSLLRGERLPPGALLGSGLVLCGVIVALQADRRRAPA